MAHAFSRKWEDKLRDSAEICNMYTFQLLNFLPTKCPQEQIKLNAFKWGKVEEILLNQHLRCAEFLLIK